MPWAWQAETFVFFPLCFTFGIWDSLMGFLHLIVVQMFYVWWITSPTFFPTCFSSRAQSIYTYLNSHLDLIKKSLPVGFLTVDLHVWPDFHGNRSPLTDLTLKGMVRNSLSLQRGQYRVKKKKKSGRSFFFNFEHTPPQLFKLSHRIWVSCCILKCAYVSVENQRSL